MLHDPDFYAGQAAIELPIGTNSDFDLFRQYHGGITECIRVGSVSPSIRAAAKLPAAAIYLCPRNLLRHIRQHESHPAGFEFVQQITWMIEHGGILHDCPENIVFFAYLPQMSDRYLWLPVRADGLGEKLWVKTFYLRARSSVLSKLRRGTILRQQ